MPRRPWVMGQTWLDLLFAHWPVPAEALERVLPPGVAPDLHDGRSWVGVTPFAVRDLRLRATFPVPLLSAFPEINVRTYVTVGGKPGIWFFSLDAGSRIAVAAARRAYRLPYFRADMGVARDGTAVRYRSVRVQGDGPPAAFRAVYRPVGTPFSAEPGTLDHWLTERYCLYALDESAELLRGEIHHPPWPLQAADADIAENTMGEQIGVALEGEPLLHFCARQDVVFWALASACGG